VNATWLAFPLSMSSIDTGMCAISVVGSLVRIIMAIIFDLDFNHRYAEIRSVAV
jgi:hypothetical protein